MEPQVIPIFGKKKGVTVGIAHVASDANRQQRTAEVLKALVEHFVNGPTCLSLTTVRAE